MLTSFDDYPVHQTPEPVAHPGTGDRNFYDRYFFNGFSRDGALFFGLALGLYPNRRVMDAAFSVARGGRQHAVWASRSAPIDRAETRVGPLSVEVVQPLRELRVRVGANPSGLEADLRFRGRTVPIEEPRMTLRAGTRVVMDTSRLTQPGTWEGSLAIAEERQRIDPAHVLGVRDRSWGVRPVGEPEGGAPGLLPQFFWLWAPVHFDDMCTLVGVAEDAEGRPWHAGGSIASVGDAGTIEHAAHVAHRIRWKRDTRRAAAADITLQPHGREPLVVSLEPLLAFQMVGLGYMHPEWGHGTWQGEEALRHDAWTLAELDPLEPRHLHVQQLCRARLGAREGVGVLEQLVIGPHAPSGFRSIIDGAS
jgi:hypothetical protein